MRERRVGGEQHGDARERERADRVGAACALAVMLTP